MNKKIHAKQPQPDSNSRRWKVIHLRNLQCRNSPTTTCYLPKSVRSATLYCFIACLSLTWLSACSAIPDSRSSTVRYANPPAVGSWLKAQRELVACETEAAASHMANFGFFHPQCHQLETIGPRDYQVQSRQKVELREGPMWLLRVQHAQDLYWVPIPWHDWL